MGLGHLHCSRQINSLGPAALLLQPLCPSWTLTNRTGSSVFLSDPCAHACAHGVRSLGRNVTTYIQHLLTLVDEDMKPILIDDADKEIPSKMTMHVAPPDGQFSY